MAPRENVTDRDRSFIAGESHLYAGMQIRPGEDTPQYLAEMKDEARWSAPEPPVSDSRAATLKKILLKELPPEVKASPQDGEADTMRRVQLVFALDSNEETVSYTLYTNPVFVRPPACSAGPHGVHARELPSFHGTSGLWASSRGTRPKMTVGP